MTVGADAASTCAALAAAACFALAVAVQHGAIAEASRSSRASGALRHWSWWMGTGLDVLGVGLQAVAVGSGRLSIVQPVLLTGLVFALPASAWVERRRPSPREVGWSSLIVASLVAWYFLARPSEGGSDYSTTAGAATLGGLGLAVVALCASWRSLPARVRAGGVAVLCGAAFATASALTKSVVNHLDAGVLAVLAMWQLWALVVVAGGSFVVNQWSFSLGPLRWTLPALSVAEPLIGIALGSCVFGERLELGLVRGGAEAVVVVTMCIAVVRLARSEADRADTAAG